MDIKELFKQLNEKYPVIENQHYINYNSEFDCLTVWVYVPNSSYELIGYNFLDSELENIDEMIKEIEKVISSYRIN